MTKNSSNNKAKNPASVSNITRTAATAAAAIYGASNITGAAAQGGARRPTRQPTTFSPTLNSPTVSPTTSTPTTTVPTFEPTFPPAPPSQFPTAQNLATWAPTADISPTFPPSAVSSSVNLSLSPTAAATSPKTSSPSYIFTNVPTNALTQSPTQSVTGDYPSYLNDSSLSPTFAPTPKLTNSPTTKSPTTNSPTTKSPTNAPSAQANDNLTNKPSFKPSFRADETQSNNSQSQFGESFSQNEQIAVGVGVSFLLLLTLRRRIADFAKRFFEENQQNNYASITMNNLTPSQQNGGNLGQNSAQNSPNNSSHGSVSTISHTVADDESEMLPSFIPSTPKANREIEKINSDEKLNSCYHKVQIKLNAAFLTALAIASEKISLNKPAVSESLNAASAAISTPAVSPFLSIAAELAKMAGDEVRKNRYKNFEKLVPSLNIMAAGKFAESLARNIVIKNSTEISAFNGDIDKFSTNFADDLVEFVLSGKVATTSNARDSALEIVNNFQPRSFGVRGASASNLGANSRSNNSGRGNP